MSSLARMIFALSSGSHKAAYQIRETRSFSLEIFKRLSLLLQKLKEIEGLVKLSPRARLRKDLYVIIVEQR
jgi:hypothetical protein